MEKNISILGCGWLGLPLAVRLIAQGWLVKGSTTTPSKLPVLRSQQIDPYLVQLSGDVSVYNDFFYSDVLLVNVPPSLKKQTADDYLAQIQALVKQVELSPVKQVIFISSTSVYPDTNQEISDTGMVDFQSALYLSERIFAQSTIFKTTVIRFAGLIGPGRHPSRFFSGKTDIPNGLAPVNLIHLDDCISIIETVLNRSNFVGTYHVAAPTHPSRNEFYTLAAQVAGLPLPGFIDELKEWKIIDPVKLEHDLDYEFIHPDLLKLAFAQV
ncbi:SDR family oxidoreductase [Mucilaginibacter sp. AW1-3]